MTKIIISGGGTGGHVFPAIAIANAIKAKRPDADILFIGARGKLEMEKVPAAGYRIEGLDIAGFHRRLIVKNLSFPFKLIRSMIRARKLVSEFGPDAVIGVGGYASGPVLRTAISMHIPALIQEQNSYPGVTNRLLAGKVQKICVAYEGMDRFFPKEKIVFTGNPIRQDLEGMKDGRIEGMKDGRIEGMKGRRNEGLKVFGLSEGKTTVLVLGGSLGAGTINKSVVECLTVKKPGDKVQWFWQCGKYYFESLDAELRASSIIPHKDVHLHAFIDRMDLAYAAADIVISRAGAIAISELCAAAKPVILVPSPNVAEDHQMKNAMALSERRAALLLKDSEAVEKLPGMLDLLIQDGRMQDELKKNISAMAVTDAAERIAAEAFKLIKNTKE